MTWATQTQTKPTDTLATLAGHKVLFPNRYAWYVLVSTLDVMMTATVITYFGAIEVNSVADAAINIGGVWGLLLLKFASVLLVVAICEYIGSRRFTVGRRLSEAAIVISAAPVVLTLLQLVALGLAGQLMDPQIFDQTHALAVQ